MSALSMFVVHDDPGVCLMSLPHLRQLQDALVRRGWTVIEYLRGDPAFDVQGAASWAIQRDESRPALLLDFAGFGSMGEDIPLDRSYACAVRGTAISLYFSRVNRSQDTWQRDLAGFIDALDGAEKMPRPV
ncbi:MAG: hypothetical protein ABN482_10220 [Corticimicrobacter sp.]|uniref:hypothetical protein n=1 Tax=Corticimicrobacter sp. TaxID=2678536 RepID=UPI0032DA0B3E